LQGLLAQSRRDAIDVRGTYRGRKRQPGLAAHRRSWLYGRAGRNIHPGRIKDVIIVRGINHYPQDIETTVYNSHPALRRHCGAAFSVLTEVNGEKVVLVQEVERTYRYRLDICEIEACIREAVINEHEIALDTIVLVGPGTIPKTTSGKIQRARTRQMWLQGSFESLDAAWSRSPCGMHIDRS
jgi:acyl-CoA synthetase (AMP-forming)/AMP-acid ligase II